MKKLILLPFLMLIGCDAPQRTRLPNSPSYSDVSGYTDYTGSSGVVDDGSGTGSGSGSNTDNGSTTTEAGYEDCNLGMQYNGGSIGNFGICQHSTDERRFKAKMAQSDLTDGTCFVPIHIEGNQSFKLGIAECVHNQAEKVYYMTLYKQRPESLNGVMVLKASSVNAYMQCMNAKADYINGHPGCAYYSSCIQAADSYASTVCSTFVSTHSNNYRQVQF